MSLWYWFALFCASVFFSSCVCLNEFSKEMTILAGLSNSGNVSRMQQNASYQQGISTGSGADVVGTRAGGHNVLDNSRNCSYLAALQSSGRRVKKVCAFCVVKSLKVVAKVLFPQADFARRPSSGMDAKKEDNKGMLVSKLVQSERDKLLHLPGELHLRVVGQDDAVQAVVGAIQRSRAGLSDPNRPIASLMFLGPTGVGKTQLAKALAMSLFGTEDAIVRIDMSQYMEQQQVERLIGVPPGYVGYLEGGQLTEAIRRRPDAVVLIAEVEKAHANVFSVLLQILEEGHVTDSQGHMVSFRDTIIILTSTLGSTTILDMELARHADKGTVRDLVMGTVRSHIPPDFVNRVDEVIVFDALGIEQIKTIVRLQAKRIGQRLADQQLRLELTDVAIEWLAQKGFDPVFGARPVKRAVQRELETSLAKALLRGEFVEGDTIVVEAPADMDLQGELTFRR